MVKRIAIKKEAMEWVALLHLGSRGFSDHQPRLVKKCQPFGEFPEKLKDGMTQIPKIRS